MSSIPVEFLHTDSDAHLPPPGHQWAPVRRYRTRSFTFPLALDERLLLVANAHLAPLVTRLRQRVASSVAVPIALVATTLMFTIFHGTATLSPIVRALLIALAPVASWLAVHWAMSESLRHAGLAGGESLVLTHQRVLRFAPAPWRWRGSAPGTESPYDVTEVAHEAIASVRASHVLGFDHSGVLEIITFRGERLVFVHVPDVVAVAERIRTVATAYAERGKQPAVVPLADRPYETLPTSGLQLPATSRFSNLGPQLSM
ncbi:MAG TPA: hypothetical protein VEA99_20445 [Gemmatimonadaceae bacterium]|nr:hypothetical protein [Gemmatimonadaceae bacterium]